MFGYALNVNANLLKQLLNDIQRCLNRVFLLEQLKITQVGKKPRGKIVAWSYDMEGHVRKCVERYCELANKKVEEFQVLVWVTINSSRKNSDQLEKCQKFAHNLEMLVFGTSWKTRHSVVGQHTCKTSY